MSTITFTNTTAKQMDSSIELHSQHQLSNASLSKPESAYQRPMSISNDQKGERDDIRSDLPPPSTAVETLQRWNLPRGNMWRTFATFFAFFIVGMNDGASGALIPYLETYYDLTYTVVSLIFLSPFVGYSLAAISNNNIHMKLGQRGIACIAPLCHLVTYIIISFHPPYPVLVVFYTVSGFGNGLEDAAWCAWTGNMVSANVIQGIMQSFYSLGATLSPTIATTMVTKSGLPWYAFYYLMSGLSAIELASSAWAFWPKTGLLYRNENPRQSDSEGGRTKEALKNKITWLCALYFWAYIGAEVSLGGWIVTFMMKVRSATHYASGISATGFWAGMTAGRLFLGFVTERFGERRCVIIYLVCAIALQLVFWLVPKFIVSAIAVAFLGFFLGPLFPAGIVVSTKLLPKHLHVSAIGFSTAIGGTGGAILPFVVGAIAQANGVKVLQPIVLALLAVIGLLWLCLPRIKKRED